MRALLFLLLPATALAVPWNGHFQGDLVFEEADVGGVTGVFVGWGPGDKSSGIDGWVVSTDAVGTVRWQQTLGYPGEEKLLGALVGGGAVLAVGYTDHYGNGGRDGLLTRMDDGGGIIFQKSIGGPADDELHGVASGQDLGFLLLGTSDGAAWIINTDVDGNVSWDVTVDLGPEADIASDALVLDGAWYVATIGTGGIGVIKVDPSGTVEWAKSYGGTTNARPRMAGDGGGGFFVTGSVPDGTYGGEDALLLKLGGDGGVEWSATAGDSGDDRATDVVMADDLRPIVSMWSDNDGVDGGIVKFDTGGLLFDSSRWQDGVDGGAMGLGLYDDGGLLLGGTGGLALNGDGTALVEGCDDVGGGPWQGDLPMLSAVTQTPTTGTLSATAVDLEPDELPRIDAVLQYACVPDLPILGIDPSEHDYGSRSLTETANQEFVATNSGPSDLIIAGVDLAGVAAAAYTIDTDGCTGETLATGESCTIDVGFQPLVDGAHDARIEFDTNDPIEDNGVVVLAGYGEVDDDDDDAADDDDDDAADDDDSAAGDDDDATDPGGCNCNSSLAGAGWGVLVLLPLVFRRRVG